LILMLAAAPVAFIAGRKRGHSLAMLLPAIVLVLIGAAWIGFYNHRVTGYASRMPYVEYESQYEVTTPFLWLPTRPEPTYRHPVVRDWFIDYQAELYYRQRTIAGFVHELWQNKVPALLQAFPQRWLVVALLLCAPLAWRDRRFRWLLLICAAGVVAICSEIIVWPHYAAPYVPAVLALILMLLQAIARWQPPRIRCLAPALVGLFISGSIVGIVLGIRTVLHREMDGYAYRKADITANLETQGGRHLVIVRYLPGHDVHNEWVYNAADIDASPVVWAQDMGDQKNEELLHYFSGRSAWLLQESGALVRFGPYAAGTSTTGQR
jgi:hypothetical protein